MLQAGVDTPPCCRWADLPAMLGGGGGRSVILGVEGASCLQMQDGRAAVLQIGPQPVPTMPTPVRPQTCHETLYAGCASSSSTPP